MDTPSTDDISYERNIYAPRWIGNGRLSNVTKKQQESNSTENNLTVGSQTDKRSSWCSISVNDSDDGVQSKLEQSSSELSKSSTKTSVNDFQSVRNPTDLHSSSKYTSSEDFLYDGLFFNKPHNPSVVQKNNLMNNTINSFTDSPNSDFESFFSTRLTTDSVMHIVRNFE